MHTRLHFDQGLAIQGYRSAVHPKSKASTRVQSQSEKSPQRYSEHQYVFHNPVIFAPRLNLVEIRQVADEICRRLRHTKGDAVFMLPLGGVNRYSIAGGPLHNPEDDQVFFTALKASLPASVEICEMGTHAEDPVFVKEAVTRLVSMIED